MPKALLASLAPVPQTPSHMPYGKISTPSLCSPLGLALVAALAFSAPAYAQYATSAPSVQVDNTVLDSLGAPQTSADMFLPPEARQSGRGPLSSSQGIAAQASRNGLLPPPPTAPRSQLMLAPVGGFSTPRPKATASHPPARRQPPVAAAPKAPKKAYTPTVSVMAPAPEAAVSAPPPVAAPTPAPSPAPTPVAAAPAPSPAAIPAAVSAPATPPTPPAASVVAALAPQTPTPQAPAAPITAPTAPPPVALGSATPSAQPSAAYAVGETLTLPFAPNTSDVPGQATVSLKALSQQLAKNPSLSVRIQAYAAGDASSVSKARRLSLSRALAVRSFLMEQGIDPTRIEVRALGTPSSGAADRVDVDTIRS